MEPFNYEELLEPLKGDELVERARSESEYSYGREDGTEVFVIKFDYNGPYEFIVEKGSDEYLLNTAYESQNFIKYPAATLNGGPIRIRFSTIESKSAQLASYQKYCEEVEAEREAEREAKREDPSRWSNWCRHWFGKT